MRVRYVSGFLCVALSVGCRDDRERQAAEAAASAHAAAAAAAGEAIGSAQALASAAAAQSPTSIRGAVHSVGGELGSWDIVLGDCQSGESNGFYGVDLYVAGTKDLRLRYVHDEAKGEIVKIVHPSKQDTMLVLDRNEKCAVLEGSLEKTSFTTWTPKGKIRHLSGRVKFDCKHTGGKGRVTGEATFSHCH